VARIGVHRALLLQTLAPVFAAAIAAIWQGERLTAIQASGAALILAGVALVVAPERGTRGEGAPVRAWALGGIAFATVAAFGQGAGVVLAKAGMEQVPVITASFVRLAAAAVGLTLIGSLRGRVRRLTQMARSSASLSRVVAATLMGTYLALFLMMAGVAWAPASVAAVLLSTSPVFSLLIGAVVDRRPITLRGLGGTLLAIAGVALLTAV
jgi:drug/metabolite transporter (DMT)-like permease